MSCRCPHPGLSANPRHAGECERCGLPLPPSGPEATARLLDRLSEALPGWPDEQPETWLAFRRLTEYRVAQGEERYGDGWRERDNLAEAAEEVADFAAYCSFSAALHGEADIDLALTAAWHAFRAYEAAVHLQAKRRGAPA